MNDFYYTIGSAITHEIKVKGSRFIGHAAVTDSREAAEAFIEQVAKKHYDATHNCFAYRAGLGEQTVFRYSDDGEPSGTAGKPIQDAIDGRDLTQVTCVVTRYFGGTKLGCGGLGRAYGGCAAETLDKAGRRIRYIFETVSVQYPYDMTGIVRHVTEKYEGKIVKSIYTEQTKQSIGLRQSRVEAFKKELIEASAGKVFLAEADR